MDSPLYYVCMPLSTVLSRRRGGKLIYLQPPVLSRPVGPRCRRSQGAAMMCPRSHLRDLPAAPARMQNGSLHPRRNPWIPPITTHGASKGDSNSPGPSVHPVCNKGTKGTSSRSKILWEGYGEGWPHIPAAALDIRPLHLRLRVCCGLSPRRTVLPIFPGE